MIEFNVAIDTDGVRLAGTLCLPGNDRRFPRVLLVAGSGQIDRNENARGLKINNFLTIAHHLVFNGFASLRYDKRGVGKSSGVYFSTGFHNNVTDATAVFRFLADHERIQPTAVFLLGHSEGALITAKMAAEQARIAGVILLSGSAQNLETVLKRQAQIMASNIQRRGGINKWLLKLLCIDIIKSQGKSLDRIRGSKKPWIRQQLKRVNARWMRELLAFDVTAAIREIRCPVLAVTGAKDIQVCPDDVHRIKELVGDDCECQVVPNLSHLLRLELGKPSFFGYKKSLRTEMDGGVLVLIADWLNKCLAVLESNN